MVLKSGCSYETYLYNPDVVVSWEDVFSLECFMSEDDCCPICLMKHSAPRAAKCGHMFCLTCITYYLGTHKDGWVKCPICSEYLDIHSLRPVTILPSHPLPQEGKTLTMPLVVRHRNVVNGFPADREDIEQLLLRPLPSADVSEDVKSFCHLLKYSFQYEYNQIKHEIEELNLSEESMNEVGEVLFLNVLKLVRRDLQAKLNSLEPYITKCSQLSATTSSSSSSQFTSPLLKEDKGGDLVFYYSCPTLLSYHLHPFTMKCLRSQYGELCDLPLVITSTVFQLEDTEVMSKTFRDSTLHHLPVSTPMTYVELEVRPLLIGRLEDKLWKEMKEREAARRRHQRFMKREERRINVSDCA